MFHCAQIWGEFHCQHPVVLRNIRSRVTIKKKVSKRLKPCSQTFQVVVPFCRNNLNPSSLKVTGFKFLPTRSPLIQIYSHESDHQFKKLLILKQILLCLYHKKYGIDNKENSVENININLGWKGLKNYFCPHYTEI